MFSVIDEMATGGMAMTAPEEKPYKIVSIISGPMV
jgi:hypothetical protein